MKREKYYSFNFSLSNNPNPISINKKISIFKGATFSPTIYKKKIPDLNKPSTSTFSEKKMTFFFVFLENLQELGKRDLIRSRNIELEIEA